MAVDPQVPLPRTDGDADDHARLRADLRTLRVEGLARVRDIHVPHLEDAAAAVGLLDDDPPLREAIEALLLRAVQRLGESREADAARCMFGLGPGARLRGATDRRRAAARAQAVGIDRFRKHYEPLLISAVADEVLVLRAQAGRGEAAAPEPSDEPGRSGRHGRPVLERALFTAETPVSTVMARARATADWDLVEGVYRQCVEIAEDGLGTTMPSDVVGFLCEAFGRIASHYYGREDELVLHAMAILGNVDRSETVSPALFERLYGDGRFDRFPGYADAGGSLRRPRPFESLVESARRFRDVTTVQRILARVPTAGILGGSLNYGRFFTVRGAHQGYPGSDVDAMVVLPDFSRLAAAVEGLAQVGAASRADVADAAERARVFAALGLDDGRTVFSHPVRMWTDRDDPMMAWASTSSEYRLDLTFTSLAALDWLLVADTTKLTGEAAGHGRSVREYAHDGDEAENHQRSFSGRNLRLPQDEKPIERGVLRASRAYTIDDDGGRYYPGVLQNMLLPRLSQRWGSGGLVPISGRLEAFRWKIVERLRLERRLRPYELMRMSLAHTRWEMFAPHVRRSVDSSDNTA